MDEIEKYKNEVIEYGLSKLNVSLLLILKYSLKYLIYTVNLVNQIQCD